jgi:ribosome biogenesis GTPase / thiamine phosphate phosphatase
MTADAQPLPVGLVVACHGRHYLVELPDSTVIDCITRGRRHDIACGDRVSVMPDGAGHGVIERIEPRATLLYRSDARRQKLVAANVAQAIIVVAAVPSVYEDLVDRCLAAIEHAGIAALIVLNKADLPETAAALAGLELYLALGYPVIALSAKRDLSPLRPRLAGRTSVLVGQSGMGKSTIVNGLVPDAAVRTAEISVALDSGRHTTTHSRLYRLDPSTWIIDSPGLQEFGLHHLDWREAAHAFVEFRPWLDNCRFRNCRHMGEPGCALDMACAGGTISARRLGSYRRLAAGLQRKDQAPPLNPARGRR